MTNLEHLHLVHESLVKIGRVPGRTGYTTYQCHILCGHLEISMNETIVVLLKSLHRVNNFMHVLCPILTEHDIIIDRFDAGSWRILFKNNSNMVKFMSIDTIKIMHPLDTGMHSNSYIIEDLD